MKEGYEIKTYRKEGEKKRILLADDEAAVLKVTKLRLEHEGFEVVTATDGEKAVKQASNNGRFDVVLLDLKMPKLDVFQVVRKLKENPSTAKIPVILFTASSERWQTVIDKCSERGIADYLRKPFLSKELVEKIRRVMNQGGESDV